MARPGLRQHPKFIHLLRLLGSPPESHVVGYLQCLWDVARDKGDPVMGDFVNVETAAAWHGEAGILCSALFEARLLDELLPGIFSVHDLEDHVEPFVAQRIRRTKVRKAKREQTLNARTTRAQRAPSSPCLPLSSPPITPSPNPNHSPSLSAAAEREDSETSNRSGLDSANGISKGVSRTGISTASISAKADSGPFDSAQADSASLDSAAADKTTRRELTKAVASVTGLDPGTSGSFIGRVVKILCTADPPYAAAEVLALPEILGKRGFTLPLTPGTVEKYIGWVRSAPSAKKAAEEAAKDKAFREKKTAELREQARRELESAGPKISMREAAKRHG